LDGGEGVAHPLAGIEEEGHVRVVLGQAGDCAVRYSAIRQALLPVLPGTGSQVRRRP
jgi:hypothetical protein